MIRPVLLVLCCWFTWVSYAGEVVISGKAPQLAGTLLQAQCYEEYFTQKEIYLAETTVDSTGNFQLHFPLDETRMIFFHLGKNMVYMFAEPGKKYAIDLPPKNEKTAADLLNPYFQEIQIMAGFPAIDTTDLNYQIQKFDDIFGSFFTRYAVNIYDKNNYRDIDSSVQVIQRASYSKHPWFLSYKKYKIALLRHVAFQFKARHVSDTFFLNKPILYQNPAYLELFHMVYSDYFNYFGRTKEGSAIFNDIGTAQSYNRLSATLGKDNVLSNDTLRELVILKNLHDEFYRSAFPRQSLLKILDSIILSTPLPNHKMIALNIQDKITRLMAGYPPPSFKLNDRNGNQFQLSSLHGKYVYLNFCSCYSYSCLKEFEMLQKIYQKHKDRLEIVTISVDPNLKQMQDFLKNNQYSWTFLHFGNHVEVLREYDIRTFPTYFLIGPDGKLLLSPAPSPAENIELYLFQVMRSRGDV